MPITCSIPVRNLSQDQFDAIDRVVMKSAYDTQNELGRLCDERVYENELKSRLLAIGLKRVHTQIPVTVSSAGFEKQYFIDLLVDDALYELKTVGDFTTEHDAQVLHYAMLLGINHGKLLNFRTNRVKGRLRFNAVSTAARQRWAIESSAITPSAATRTTVVSS